MRECFNIGSEEDNKMAIMKWLCEVIRKERLKQREVAEVLDIKQPRVSDLLAMKHDRFSLDLLIKYMAIFGHKLSLTFKETNRGKSINAKILKTTKSKKLLRLKN
ncbi:XRE family transcriptional regulator [Vibrio parahaemolyticus]|nr:XRE family transcriptional regulator [Vibrio parahaemolyticus]